jgi:hypothetical protein
MKTDLKKYILDAEQSLRKPLQAWGWIAVTIVIVICFSIVIAEMYVWTWIFRLAQVILIGASTALFTRFLGAMGMFRDAIADVLGDDKWLDRRNDLEDLWRRITRRIFLPGFREDSQEANGLLMALNATMNSVIHKPEQRVNYFAKNMIRRLRIYWQDPVRKIIAVEDVLETKIIPFDPLNGCTYDMIFYPTTGEQITDYTVSLSRLSLNGVEQDIALLSPIVENNRHRISVSVSGSEIRLSRTTVSTQSVENDPIFVVGAGRVVWGLNVIITVEAEGLRINFEEVGVDGMFRLVREDAGRVHEWSTEGALLPDQGFMVVMAVSGTTARNVTNGTPLAEKLVYSVPAPR